MKKNYLFPVVLIVVMAALILSIPAYADKYTDTMDVFKKSEVVQPFFKNLESFVGDTSLGGAVQEVKCLAVGHKGADLPSFQHTIQIADPHLFMMQQRFSCFCAWRSKKHHENHREKNFESLEPPPFGSWDETTTKFPNPIAVRWAVAFVLRE